MKYLFFTLPKIEITPQIRHLLWELKNYDRHKQAVINTAYPPQISLADMYDSFSGAIGLSFPHMLNKYSHSAIDTAIGFEKQARTLAYFDNESRFKPLAIETNIFVQSFGFRCSSLYKALLSNTKENNVRCKQTRLHPYLDLDTLGEKPCINLLNNATIHKLNIFKKCIIVKQHINR